MTIYNFFDIIIIEKEKEKRKMKIENHVYDDNRIFEELTCGDVFIYEDEVYMKTDGDDGESNAVSLETGRERHLYKDDEVRLVAATLTIE